MFLNEFIESNVNMKAMIKNVKHAELNINIETVFLNIRITQMVMF